MATIKPVLSDMGAGCRAFSRTRTECLARGIVRGACAPSGPPLRFPLPFRPDLAPSRSLHPCPLLYLIAPIELYRAEPELIASAAPERGNRMRGKVLALVLLSVASPFAAATPYGVQVGGTTTSSEGGYYGGTTTVPVLMFSPSAMTINVGDTITFTNVGGTTAMHNVVADDGSFRCANGCDGAGGNGAPASNQWHATVTFNKAGVFNYHCENHGVQGMTGTITVNAVATTTPISGGFSGNWFNPTAGQGGHGFQ